MTVTGAPFEGIVLTSYQFTDRPGANLFTYSSAGANYNCSTQTGTLKSVAAGTRTNTVAYRAVGRAITNFTATFLVANYAESFTIKWFVAPAASASPLVWYGPFPQVVNAVNPQFSG